jgi:hypothetical protein
MSDTLTYRTDSIAVRSHIKKYKEILSSYLSHTSFDVKLVA